MFHKLHVLGMNDDLWDRVRGLKIILEFMELIPTPPIYIMIIFSSCLCYSTNQSIGIARASPMKF